ncbi:pilus assembly protein [uncultured Brevundimonas sp.]|uniref:pilus assembly protein n=1 Tax=uncultured Brevundimonas sp. TaxID=213418 RepID=UPI002629B3B7|nr:pilus assembly protein [uncultured Brevundimonas sp.]
MIFGLSLPVIVMLSLGGIDLHRVTTARSQFQDALDAATLSAARSSYTDPADLKTVTLITLRANLENTEVEPIQDSDVTVTMSGTTVVVSDAVGQVKTLVANIVLPPYGQLLDDTLPINVHSEVNRSAKNLEVAMVLDVTGSMSGSDIANLKTAALKMVDIVVKDVQTPYSSRMSVIPYSMGVNLGSRAAAARGPVTAGKTITGAAKACTSNPTSCTITVTAANHGFAVNDRVVVTGVSGMAINSATRMPKSSANTAFTVTARTTNTFSYVISQNVSGNYSNGGTAYCTTAGCQYLAYTNTAGSTSVHEISNCVTERIGTNAYTDVSPASAYVGRNYPSTNENTCLTVGIQPLTSDRTSLKSIINSLSDGGSTAGHIGTAWGWYTVAPNFNSLWPAASAANDYDEFKTIKAVVLMTDGDFNTPYYSGVIAKNSLSGSYQENDVRINQNASNGSSASQAQKLCTAMKAKGVVVYTVGFSITANSAAATLLSGCASSSDKAYLANSGTALVAAFEAIGRDITKLRISR